MNIDKHCSVCEYYETVNYFMYCRLLKRRITARKKYCKNFKPITKYIITERKMENKQSMIEEWARK